MAVILAVKPAGALGSDPHPLSVAAGDPPEIESTRRAVRETLQVDRTEETG
ncbi:hypothetical protein [Streptomyces sp. NPDC053755]|uniref:hypothetical protein n=1 Tax=Streptomyces sp. NPDC053755 TaxID=3155815 RepID=UPI003446CF83